jgi:hypothetical protein
MHTQRPDSLIDHPPKLKGALLLLGPAVADTLAELLASDELHEVFLARCKDVQSEIGEPCEALSVQPGVGRTNPEGEEWGREGAIARSPGNSEPFGRRGCDWVGLLEDNCPQFFQRRPSLTPPHRRSGQPGLAPEPVKSVDVRPSRDGSP